MSDSTSDTVSFLERIGNLHNESAYRDLHWEGSFEDYLEMVHQDPTVTRTAYQRIYDMLISYGHEEYTRNRETLVHYRFFDDPFDNGRDAVFGLDQV